MKGFTVLTLAAFVIMLVIVGPIFSIMALNVLFGTGIELGIGTWLAVAWLHMIVTGTKTFTSQKGK